MKIKELFGRSTEILTLSWLLKALKDLDKEKQTSSEAPLVLIPQSLYSTTTKLTIVSDHAFNRMYADFSVSWKRYKCIDCKLLDVN